MSKALEAQVLAFHRDVRSRTYAEATYWLNQYVRLSGNLMQEVRRLQAELERKEQRIKELESRNGN